ncbi:hypothetical protein BGZ94_003107, partial [Podila epigama]
MPATPKPKKDDVEENVAAHAFLQNSATTPQHDNKEKSRVLVSKKMPSNADASSTSLGAKDKDMVLESIYPILWWTDIPAEEQIGLGHKKRIEDDDKDDDDDCGLPYTCTWTKDRAFIDTATVVVIEGSALLPTDLPPTPRNVSQAWVLYSVPPPATSSSSPIESQPGMESALPSLGFTHSWSNSPLANFVVNTFYDLDLDRRPLPNLPPSIETIPVTTETEREKSTIEGEHTVNEVEHERTSTPQAESGDIFKSEHEIGALILEAVEAQAKNQEEAIATDKNKRNEPSATPRAASPVDILNAVTEAPW